MYCFFHWQLAFPQVFARGGFDVVLGNPPWDSLLFREEELFAGSRPDIAEAPTAAVRKRMIAKLAQEDATLFHGYQEALRMVEGANAFVRSGARFPLCGVGRVNLFALFAEAGRQLVSRSGRVGHILPSGIVADDSTKLFFQAVVDGGQLVSFTDFENREGIFEAVHRSFKFGILTLSQLGSSTSTRKTASFP
jgi:glycosyltransferase involved in cell wall biosynthesis